MNDKTKPDHDTTTDTAEPRRRLLRSVAAGGTALGLTALPGQWAKPIVASVILPAHAQTSPNSGGACCDLSQVYSDSYSGTYTLDASSVTNKYSGFTYQDGTLTGSYGTSTVVAIGPCPDPCAGDGQKYISKYLGFDGDGNKYAGLTFGIRCEDDPVFRKYLNFEGSQIGNGGGSITYDGSGTVGFEVCDELDVDIGDIDVNRARAPAGGNIRERARRHFQFGP